MKPYLNDKDKLAQSVIDLLANLKLDYPLTMTIRQEKYGAFSVQIVTDELSDDYDEEQQSMAKFFSETQVST